MATFLSWDGQREWMGTGIKWQADEELDTVKVSRKQGLPGRALPGLLMFKAVQTYNIFFGKVPLQGENLSMKLLAVCGSEAHIHTQKVVRLNL